MSAALVLLIAVAMGSAVVAAGGTETKPSAEPVQTCNSCDARQAAKKRLRTSREPLVVPPKVSAVPADG